MDTSTTAEFAPAYYTLSISSTATIELRDANGNDLGRLSVDQHRTKWHRASVSLYNLPSIAAIQSALRFVQSLEKNGRQPLAQMTAMAITQALNAIGLAYRIYDPRSCQHIEWHQVPGPDSAQWQYIRPGEKYATAYTVAPSEGQAQAQIAEYFAHWGNLESLKAFIADGMPVTRNNTIKAPEQLDAGEFLVKYETYTATPDD